MAALSRRIPLEIRARLSSSAPCASRAPTCAPALAVAVNVNCRPSAAASSKPISTPAFPISSVRPPASLALSRKIFARLLNPETVNPDSVPAIIVTAPTNIPAVSTAVPIANKKLDRVEPFKPPTAIMTPSIASPIRINPS